MDWRIDPIYQLSQIEDLTLDGYYWDFPEVLLAWGQGLRNAHLIKVQTPLASAFVRARVNECTVASWRGATGPEAWEQMRRALADYGLRSVKFQPLSVDLKAALPGGFRGAVWYSRQSWQATALSRHRRWLFSTALRRYEFVPIRGDPAELEEAMQIITRWRAAAGERQFIMGSGTYYSAVRLHPELPGSRLFFCRRRATGENVGLLGGYIRPPYSVVVNVKHDYSDKHIINALWGFWLDYVHSQGVLLNCNGSTSDDIKRRMHMERQLFYKPPKMSLAAL